MGPTNEHVGTKILAKIKIYVLIRAELLFTLCYEIPCILTCVMLKVSDFLILNMYLFRLSIKYQPKPSQPFYCTWRAKSISRGIWVLINEKIIFESWTSIDCVEKISFECKTIEKNMTSKLLRPHSVWIYLSSLLTFMYLHYILVLTTPKFLSQFVKNRAE